MRSSVVRRFACAALPALAALALGAVPAGCSSKPDVAPEPAASAAPAVVPTPVAPTQRPPVEPVAPPPVQQAATDSVPADFPPECADYALLIGKLRACAKLGGARDGLSQGYNSLRASWSTLTPEQRAGFGPQCRTQAESLRNAAAATCGL